jgi:ferritin-like metal-binding protein YciE
MLPAPTLPRLEKLAALDAAVLCVGLSSSYANVFCHSSAKLSLVNETEMMLGMLNGNDLRDAGLIASAQKLEHYVAVAPRRIASMLRA